jgi:hypothetical protein
VVSPRYGNIDAVRCVSYCSLPFLNMEKAERISVGVCSGSAFVRPIEGIGVVLDLGIQTLNLETGDSAYHCRPKEHS